MSSAIAALGPLSEFIAHTNFTKVQEKVIPSLINSQQNAIIAAPTGSGKTVLLEVAMLRLFRSRLLRQNDGDARRDGDSCHEITARQKAVYICPIKALANEKYELWKEKFPTLSVIIETGDQEREKLERDSLTSVSSADIIITTPERWDSITRRWKEKTVMEVVHSVGLLLLDEIHTVHEERGAALEAVVSRMKAIKSAALSSETSGTTTTTTTSSALGARFVAISGTLPNVKDFAEWLSVPPQMVFTFSAKDRPVPLSVHVIGYANDSKNPFAFDRFLNFKLFHTIKQYSDGKPTMVFCSSRKEAVTSAQRLVQDIQTAADRDGQAALLQPSAEVEQFASSANDKHLRACLLLGIAFHHAAMTLNDRRLVEQMFKEQYVAVICTTTTLALGVNLPAHLVVIKGTHFFKNGKREDVPLSEMMQMCGRAGRPGLDNHGIAVVLTTESKVRFYQSLRSGDVYSTVESQLHRHMIEHVNAEVALRTIHSFQSALDWVRTTFFWIRLQKAPQNYGLTFKSKADADAFRAEAFIERLMERVLRALAKEDCVVARRVGDNAEDIQEELDREDGDGANLLLQDTSLIETTRIGRSLARLYILFGTVQTFNAFIQRRINSKANEKGTTLLEEESKANSLTGDTEARDSMSDTELRGDKDTCHVADTREENEDEDSDEEESIARRANEREDGPKRSYLLAEVLTLLCHSEEFVDVHLRQGDRGPLNEFNKVVKYPLRGGHKGGREVREDWQKAYVLLQVQLGQLTIQDVSLRNDFYRLWSVIPRVARFLVDYTWTTKSFSFALQAVVLLRCIEQHVWEDGLVLRQLDGVGESVARALARGGFRDFKSVLAADPRKLEVLCSRLPPFGSQVKAQVEAVPRCRMTVKRVMPTSSPANQSGLGVSSSTSTKFTVEVYPVLQSTMGSVYPTDDGNAVDTADGQQANASRTKHLKLSKLWSFSSFLLLVGHASSDQIFLQRFIPISTLFDKKNVGQANFTFLLPAGVPCSGTRVHLLTGHFVGSDQSVLLNQDGVATDGGHGGRDVNSCSRKIDEFLITKQEETKAMPEKGAPRKTSKRTRATEEDTASIASSPRKQKANLSDTTDAALKANDTSALGEDAKPASSYDQLLKDLQWIETNGHPRPSAARAQKKDSVSTTPFRPEVQTTRSSPQLQSAAPATPEVRAEVPAAPTNYRIHHNTAHAVSPLADEEEGPKAAGLDVSLVPQDEGGAAEQPPPPTSFLIKPQGMVIQLNRCSSPEPQMQQPQQHEYRQEAFGPMPTPTSLAPTPEVYAPDQYPQHYLYGGVPMMYSNMPPHALPTCGGSRAVYMGESGDASFHMTADTHATGGYGTMVRAMPPQRSSETMGRSGVEEEGGEGRGRRFHFNVNTNHTLCQATMPPYGDRVRNARPDSNALVSGFTITGNRGGSAVTARQTGQQGITIHPGSGVFSHQNANRVYYPNGPAFQQSQTAASMSRPQIAYAPVYPPQPPRPQQQQVHLAAPPQPYGDQRFVQSDCGRACMNSSYRYGEDDHGRVPLQAEPTHSSFQRHPSEVPASYFQRDIDRSPVSIPPTSHAYYNGAAPPHAVRTEYQDMNSNSSFPVSFSSQPLSSAPFPSTNHFMSKKNSRSRGGNKNNINQFQPIQPNWW